MTLTINIVGAGKVGKTIGRLMVQHNVATIGGIYTRTQQSAKQALAFIGAGTYYPTLDNMPYADVTFITTPDDHIAATLAALNHNNIKSGNIFVHCSGVLTAEILTAVKAHGGLVASMHPMRSFALPATAVANFSGTYCAMEGDAPALKIIAPLFTALGAIVYQIAQEKKTLYHAAGVFASNYLVTLADQATQCLYETGVDKDMAFKIIISLMQGTLVNLEKTLSTQEALTGPLQRGDRLTIKNHLAVLTDNNTKLLYAALGKATLDLTAHDSAIKKELEFTLSPTS